MKTWLTDLAIDLIAGLAIIFLNLTKKYLKCGSYKSWTDLGYEYDCEYNPGFPCEECILCGGDKNPLRGENNE